MRLDSELVVQRIELNVQTVDSARLGNRHSSDPKRFVAAAVHAVKVCCRFG